MRTGESRHVVAKRLGLGASTVIGWLDNYKKTGSAAPAKFGGYRKPKIAGRWRDWLLDRIGHGDFTLRETIFRAEGPHLTDQTCLYSVSPHRWQRGLFGQLPILTIEANGV